MSELLFHATVRHGADVAVVEGTGELDISTAPVLSDAIEDALRRRPSVLLVDLRGTTFFAGVGAEILFHTRGRCHEAGVELRIAASNAVRRILDLVGFPADTVDAPARGRHRLALHLRSGGGHQSWHGRAARGTGTD